jgi:hypothetical protein
MIASTLNRVFVKRFYRDNASVFLLLIVFAGGFMRSQDHIALAEIFTSSILLTAIPITIWILYALFVLNYNRVLVSRAENLFLQNFILLPYHLRITCCILVVFEQLLPVLFYSIFLIAIATKHQEWFSIIVICTAIATICLLGTFLLNRIFFTPIFEKKVFSFNAALAKRISKPYVTFAIEWALRRRTVALLGFKLLSLSIFWSSLFLYSTESYDIRLISLGTLLAFSTNIVFVLELHRFENQHFQLIRHLPFRLFQRLGYLAIVLILFNMPETILYLRQFPEQFRWIEIMSVFAYGISIPFFFNCYMYWKDKREEKMMAFVYAYVILSFILILFKIPIVILLLLNVLLGSWIFHRSYYAFEYISEL